MEVVLGLCREELLQGGHQSTDVAFRDRTLAYQNDAGPFRLGGCKFRDELGYRALVVADENSILFYGSAQDLRIWTRSVPTVQPRRQVDSIDAALLKGGGYGVRDMIVEQKPNRHSVPGLLCPGHDPFQILEREALDLLQSLVDLIGMCLGIGQG